MGAFNRSFPRVGEDRRRLARQHQLARERQELEIRHSVEAAALSARAGKQDVSVDSAGTPVPVKGAGQMAEYSKFMTQKEFEAEVDAELARREHIRKNMMDLPETYRNKMPRRTQGIGGLTAAEQAVRAQFAQDMEHRRRMTSNDPVSVIARGLKQS